MRRGPPLLLLQLSRPHRQPLVSGTNPGLLPRGRLLPRLHRGLNPMRLRFLRLPIPLPSRRRRTMYRTYQVRDPPLQEWVHR